MDRLQNGNGVPCRAVIIAFDFGDKSDPALASSDHLSASAVAHRCFGPRNLASNSVNRFRKAVLSWFMRLMAFRADSLVVDPVTA